MAWTSAEESRVRAIETMLNKVQVAVTNLVSKLQLNQLLMVKQKEIDALTQRVENLETQVQTLQDNTE